MNVERVQNSAKLVTLDERLCLATAILSHIPAGMMVINIRHPNLPIVFCNSHFFRLTGIASDEAIGRAFPPLLSRLVGSQAAEQCIRNVNDQRAFCAEMPIDRPKQEVLGARFSFSLLEDGDDFSTALLVTIKDVTSSRRAWEALNETTSLYHVLFSSLAEAVIVSDDRGRVVSHNRAAESLFGPLPDYCQLEKARQFVDEAGLPCQPDSLPARLALRTGRPQRGVILGLQTPGQPTTWLSVHTRPLRHVDEPMPHAVVSSYADITQRREAELWPGQGSLHAVVTALPDRKLLRDRMEQCLKRANRNSSNFATLFLSLDGLRLLNDGLGHPAGDALLREVANRLRDTIRAEDSVCRYRGDEFVVLLTDVTKAGDIEIVARKLGKTLAMPYDIGGKQLVLTASMGISLYPIDAKTPDLLIDLADNAMDRVKRDGGNNFCFYGKDLMPDAVALGEGPPNVRDALANNELSVRFLPQVCLKSGDMAAVEALACWNDAMQEPHHSETRVPPIREYNGQLPLWEWLLETSCAQYMAWVEAGLAPPALFVNLSCMPFNEDLAYLVERTLKKTGMVPGALALSFLESAVIWQNRQMTEVVEALARLGVTLVLDNFGVGLSSINYLRHSPFRLLRIGRTFVDEITADANNRATVGGIVLLAHHLQMSVVAGDVETAMQVDTLRGLGCDAIQGILVGPPVSARTMEGLLSRQHDASVRRHWSFAKSASLLRNLASGLFSRHGAADCFDQRGRCE